MSSSAGTSRGATEECTRVPYFAPGRRANLGMRESVGDTCRAARRRAEGDDGDADMHAPSRKPNGGPLIG